MELYWYQGQIFLMVRTITWRWSVSASWQSGQDSFVLVAFSWHHRLGLSLHLDGRLTASDSEPEEVDDGVVGTMKLYVGTSGDLQSYCSLTIGAFAFGNLGLLDDDSNGMTNFLYYSNTNTIRKICEEDKTTR
jgi:hypothetical protein